MSKIRLGVVGLGHRGRHMFSLAAESARRGGEMMTINYPWESGFKTTME